eukprot:scaffold4891_cov140-Cylindrotheca_fusiformis.AAC.10
MYSLLSVFDTKNSTLRKGGVCVPVSLQVRRLVLWGLSGVRVDVALFCEALDGLVGCPDGVLVPSINPVEPRLLNVSRDLRLIATHQSVWWKPQQVQSEVLSERRTNVGQCRCKLLPTCCNPTRSLSFLCTE